MHHTSFAHLSLTQIHCAFDSILSNFLLPLAVYHAVVVLSFLPYATAGFHSGLVHKLLQPFMSAHSHESSVTTLLLKEASVPPARCVLWAFIVTIFNRTVKTALFTKWKAQVIFKIVVLLSTGRNVIPLTTMFCKIKHDDEQQKDHLPDFSRRCKPVFNVHFFLHLRQNFVECLKSVNMFNSSDYKPTNWETYTVTTFSGFLL